MPHRQLLFRKLFLIAFLSVLACLLMPRGELLAFFGDDVTLSINPPGAGSVLVIVPPGDCPFLPPCNITCPGPCSGDFATGALVTFSATANPGYTFVGWSGQFTNAINPFSYASPGPGPLSYSVTANFAVVYDLTVSVSPGGSVSGPGISCPSDCTETYIAGTNVGLTATADAGWEFTGWSGGGCSGTGTCSVTMNSNINVTANFAPIPAEVTLTVSISPPGGGSVSGSGISCPGTCENKHDYGETATLTATPAAGYTFVRWTGSAGGTSPTISLLMEGNKSVTAVFEPIQFKLTVIVTPEAWGTVTGEGIDCSGDCTILDPEIECPYDCEELVTPNTAATLTVTPAPGYYFLEWTGDARGSDSPATLIMNRDKSVTAHFTDTPPNNPPVLDPIGDKSVNEGELLEFEVSATDPDEDPLTFSADGLPEGALFNLLRVSQVFSWTPDATQEGTYAVTFSVTDGELSDSETITITVIDVPLPPVNTPPQIDPISPIQGAVGFPISFEVNATDAEQDPLTFQAQNLPAGATFNPATRVFSWTPSAGQTGTYQVVFVVSDGELSSSATATIQVESGLPGLPSPFPFEEVLPPRGGVGVDPAGVCFYWPEAMNAEAYDFMLSREPRLSPLDVEEMGLLEPFFCIGAALPSSAIGGIAASPYASGDPTASRTETALLPAQQYFWTITAGNRNGEVTYPLFGFFTQMIEGEEIETPSPLQPLAYQMISVPLYLDDDDPAAELEDDLGPYRPSQWRLFRYESSENRYHEYPNVPPMKPGIAYWLITREETKIDAAGTAVPTETDFVISIPPGYFQLGCPFPFPVDWREVKVRKGDVTVLTGDPDNEWINPELREYADGSYVPANVLEPWSGYWVVNISAETVELLIPPVMYVPEEAGE